MAANNEGDILYAYATKDGDIILTETITDLKTDLGRKLYRCFPLSYGKMKRYFHVVEIEIKIIRFIKEDKTKEA